VLALARQLQSIGRMRHLLLLASILIGCAADPTPSDNDLGNGGGKADGTESDAVRLRFATTTTSCATCAPRWFGVIDIAERGTDKQVIVKWRSETAGTFGPWQETPAHFLAVVDGGHPDHQLWAFDGVGDDGEHTTELSIDYRAGGVDYFSELYTGIVGDVAGFGDVGVSAPMGAGLDVAVTDVRVLRNPTTITLDSDVLVRNLAFEKTVRIVYSTDNWNTVNDAAATYAYGSADPSGAERWAIHLDLPSDATRIDFAVEAKQGASDAWDNNFDRNFTCVIDATDTAGVCSGLTLSLVH
jgi:hypothetical protein